MTPSLEQDDLAPETLPECTGSMCHEPGTIDSGDFGIVCPSCYRQICNTVGT